MKARKREHKKNGKNRPRYAFQRALSKYGFDAFEWTILTRAYGDDELNKLEACFIKVLGSKVPNGYNLTDGGEGTSGWEPSEETKRKISEATQGRQAWNKGVPNLALRGKPFPCNWKGKHHTEEAKEKMRKAKLGKHHSQETKVKISKTKKGTVPWMKGRSHTPEAIAKNREAHLGMKHSPEHIRKNRVAAMKKPRDSLGRFLPRSWVKGGP